STTPKAVVAGDRSGGFRVRNRNTKHAPVSESERDQERQVIRAPGNFRILGFRAPGRRMARNVDSNRAQSLSGFDWTPRDERLRRGDSVMKRNGTAQRLWSDRAPTVLHRLALVNLSVAAGESARWIASLF